MLLLFPMTLTLRVAVAELLGVGVDSAARRAVLVIHHLTRLGRQIGLGEAMLDRVAVHEGNDVGQFVAGEQAHK